MLAAIPIAACSVYGDIPAQRGDSPDPRTGGAAGTVGAAGGGAAPTTGQGGLGGAGAGARGGSAGTSGEGGGAGVGGIGGAGGKGTTDASDDRGGGSGTGVGGAAGASGNTGTSGGGGVSSGGGAGTVVIDSGPTVDSGGAAGGAGRSGGGGTAGVAGNAGSAGGSGSGSAGGAGGGSGASGGNGGSGGTPGADAGSKDAPAETGGLCSSGACKRVFVTSSSPASSGAIGGLVAADAFCQSAANANQLGGAWKAWLSTSSTSAASRLAHATVPYRLLDGATVAANWAGLTSGTLSHAINVTEAGVVVPSGTILEVWTGTTTAGAHSGDTCNAWTDGSATPRADIGLTSETSSGWTAKYLQFCDRTNLRLYCFQQ